MEGLYIKLEEDGAVRERYKYVRSGFLQTVLDSGSHWLDRPLVPNGLREGVDLLCMSTWTFPHVPAPPDWRIDWDAIAGRFAWIRAMAGVPRRSRPTTPRATC